MRFIRSWALYVGWKVVYDKSKVITNKSVPLISKVPVYGIWCDGERINIEAGEQVEHMQYCAEGFGTVIIHDKVCEVDLESGDFGGLDQEPVTEWWVRVINKDKKAEGWLLVDDEQLNFLRRQF